MLWQKCVPALLFALVICAGAVSGLYALRVQRSASEARVSVKRVRPEAHRTSAGRWQAAAENSSVLDNQSVIAMARTNLSPRTLVKAIERSACRFDMSPSAIIRMKAAGVADDVIYAMLSNLDQCEAPSTTAIDNPLQEKLTSAIAAELTAPVQ
jgi:hypothetical protein